jgi:hypothetical protein
MRKFEIHPLETICYRFEIIVVIFASVRFQNIGLNRRIGQSKKLFKRFYAPKPQ